MNKSLVIYHRADFDGICSREVAKHFLGRTADYLGWDYGDDVPDLSERQIVYLIDISLPPPVMLANKAKLIWIDHHKTAIDANPADIAGLRIDGVAACRLAWQFFFGTQEEQPVKEDYVELYDIRSDIAGVIEPYAVRLLGEYDIWDKRNPDTDFFQVGLSSVKDIDWEKLFTGNRQSPYVRDIIDRGEVIFDYLAVNNRQISNERGFDIEFEGLKFRVLNTCRSNSLTFKDSVKEHHDGCMSYYWHAGVWKFSLYGVEHKKTLDLSTIAKKYGGGGHRQACGFTLKTLPDSLGFPAGSVAS